MNSCTDSLHLSEHKMFEIISKNLPDDLTKTQNIIECKDDLIFAWNAKDSCVLSLNIQAARGENADTVPHQTLLCTCPPCFSVERLSLSLGSAWLCLYGPQGASLMELPRRWGPQGGFQGGRDVVTCRTLPLDERYFSSGSLATLLQARWHPASSSDSHLLVLTAENTFRLYDARSSTIALLQVWPIGRRPVAFPPLPSKLPYLTGLGDTAVDFDFAPPVICKAASSSTNTNMSVYNDDTNTEYSTDTMVSDENRKNTSKCTEKVVDWPIVVLKGNGDVFTVNGTFFCDKPFISSPLLMTPASEDNYGSESCSILVHPTIPPIIVVANSLGTIYHCLMMPSESDDDNKPWMDNQIISISPDCHLFVLESVELELGITIAKCQTTGPQDVCPLRLLRDDSQIGRYIVYHDTGVHAITVSVAEQLQEFLDIEDENIHLNTPTLNVASSAEYLLCTKLGGIKENTQCPILGIALIGGPTALIVLLASGNVVSLELTSVPFTYVAGSLSQDSLDHQLKSPLKQMLKEPFDAHIRRCLRLKVTQPIIKLNPDTEKIMSPQHCFELLTRTTQVFREQYFKRHDQARQEIQKRVRVLQLLKAQQLLELERLNQDRSEVQNEAERLAERCEDIRDKQELLCKRAEILLRLSSQKSPKISQAEREFSEKLKNAENKMQSYQAQLQRAKTNMQYQVVQFEHWNTQTKKQEVILGEKQAAAIKANLQERTNEITDLIKEINVIRNSLELS